MISISFQFIAGRYHATPWGRHVNEGAVEWPPSPWRILRALIAVWKRTMPDLPQEQVEPILRALANPPEFSLPPASTGHTRHFMPWHKNWDPKKPDKAKTLIFDTFVAVQHNTPVLVRWPDASLSDTQRQTLASILSNLNTLGRSESWCEAELMDSENSNDGFVCSPLEDNKLPSGHEIARVLCPDPINAFADEYVVTIIKKSKGRGKNKQTVEEYSTVYDPAWNICMETLQLHKERWSDPPGSRWISYSRPLDCFKIENEMNSHLKVDRPRISVVRYALDSTVLPLVTETLPVAESARWALMGIYGRQKWKRLHGDKPYPKDISQRPKSEIFSGKDAKGDYLKGHVHAYYLPTDEDGDGRLDHLTVYAAGGFGTDERYAIDLLRELKKVRKGEESHPLRLLLLGMGVSGEYHLGPLQKSKVWVSTTPYIATRYAKTRGRNRVDLGSPQERETFLQEDLRAQLNSVLPKHEAEIEPIWGDNHVFRIEGRRPIEFKRFRRKPGDDGGKRLAGAFRLTFDKAMQGPIALGHSAHFGLGLFVPADNKEQP